MAEKNRIFSTIASYLSDKAAPYFLAGSLVAGTAQYANAQNPTLREIQGRHSAKKENVIDWGRPDSIRMTKKQYESLPNSIIANIHSLYYISNEPSQNSQPMYSNKDIYGNSDILWVKFVDPRDSLREKLKPFGYTIKGDSLYAILGTIRLGPFLHVQPTNTAEKPKSKYSPKPKKPFGIQRRKIKEPGKLEQKVQKEITPELTKKDTLGLEAITKHEEKKYAPGLESQTQAPDTTQPFMVINDDSLYLLKPYSELTKSQKIEWNKRTIEYIGKGFERVALGMLTKIIPETKEELRTRFGLNAFAGTKGKYGFGAFVEFPLTKWMSLEGYGNWYASYAMRNDKGLSIFSNKTTDVKTRARKSLGFGIYEDRTDAITTSLEDKAIADIGAGLTFKVPGANLEFPLTVALNFATKYKTLYGESTITQEKNGAQIDSAGISSGPENGGSKTITNLGWSAGVLYNLIGDWLSVGASVSRTGNENRIDGNVKVRF